MGATRFFLVMIAMLATQIIFINGISHSNININFVKSQKISKFYTNIRSLPQFKPRSNITSRLLSAFKLDTETSLFVATNQLALYVGTFLITFPTTPSIHRRYLIAHAALKWLEMFSTTRHILSQSNATVDDVTRENCKDRESQLLAYSLCCILSMQNNHLSAAHLYELPLILREIVYSLKSFVLTVLLVFPSFGVILSSIGSSSLFENMKLCASIENVFDLVSLPIELNVFYYIMKGYISSVVLSKKIGSVLSLAGISYIMMYYLSHRLQFLKKEAARLFKTSYPHKSKNRDDVPLS